MNDEGESALALAQQANCTALVPVLEEAEKEETRRKHEEEVERARQRALRQRQQQGVNVEGAGAGGLWGANTQAQVGEWTLTGTVEINTMTAAEATLQVVCISSLLVLLSFHMFTAHTWLLSTGGMGFFPSLFGLQFQSFAPPVARQSRPGTPAAQEEAQQAFLSRVLIVLAFLVFTCLFLF